MVGNATGTQRRILIADDNEDVAWVMARWMENRGHSVRVAHDGLEAVAAAEDFRPELILLDIHMPLLDGVDACRRIRAEPWGAALRIVAMSGWDGADAEQVSLRAGFDEHMVKPIASSALHDLLRRALP
jgi:two-component system, chemotaxis family, CheB/CheR fusion protein